MSESYNNKITWVYDYSDIAASQLPDDLDFVYIDGNHNYEYVKKDINIYYKKILPGGIISGHDYPDILDVKRAVDEFADTNNLYVYLSHLDWWITKPSGVTKNNCRPFCCTNQ